MKYDDLWPSSKSALIELYFLECLDKKKKLPKNRRIDKVSITSSVSPLKTDILPQEVKKQVEQRVFNFIEIE